MRRYVPRWAKRTTTAPSSYSVRKTVCWAVCDALNEGDYETVGQKMYETHYGLSKDYEVSCEELDYLNDLAKENGVTGSRIMGGGFGGCTINLVRNDLYKKFIDDAKKKYFEKLVKKPKVNDVIIVTAHARFGNSNYCL